MSNPFEADAADYAERINAALPAGMDVDRFARRKAKLILRSARGLSDAKAPLRLLDLGCGVGLLHAYLAGAAEVVGADSALAPLRIARRDHPQASYVHYDGQSLPFPDRCFDIGLAVCVLHHVPPPRRNAMLAELRRVIRLGGLLILIEHNPRNPATRWTVSRCAFDKDAELVGAAAMRRLLGGAGFENAEIRFFQFTPWAGALARLLDAALAWLPLGAQYAALARRTG